MIIFVVKTDLIMEQQYPLDVILFYILYGEVIMLAFVASLYLLLRPVNIFNKDITPPLRLRRWMAVTFASVALSHLWWLPLYYGQTDSDPSCRLFLCRSLDAVFNWSITFNTMLVMLQDRRRPLWLTAVFMAFALSGPLVNRYFGPQASTVAMLLSVATPLYVGLVLMVAVRQYGRWLRDNYADLEHKEVWQTILAMLAFLPSIFFYSFLDDYKIFDFLLEVINIPLIFFLLWRVETLQTLEEPADDPSVEDTDLSDAHLFVKIELLLQQKCIDTQYYLQHDISLSLLAKHIGTNTTYLSRYFTYKGITYHTYINTLRIEHFMHLYQETIRTGQFVTAAELSYESGYKSYSTFGTAFKQVAGLTATAWMKQQKKALLAVNPTSCRED